MALEDVQAKLNDYRLAVLEGREVKPEEYAAVIEELRVAKLAAATAEKKARKKPKKPDEPRDLFE